MKIQFSVLAVTLSLLLLPDARAYTNWTEANQIAPGAPVRAAGIVELRTAIENLKTDLDAGSTISGDLNVNSVTVNGTNGLMWESGVNRITHNDGGGNVQIRFGHDFTTSDERFTQAGGSAFYIGGAMDSAQQPLEMRVSTDAAPANDGAVTWGPTFRVTTGGINTDGDISAFGTRFWGDNKEMFRFSDSWLRLNPAGNFTSGVYMNTPLRNDSNTELRGLITMGPADNRSLLFRTATGRNLFAPRLADNSNWDWGNEFGFHRDNNAWYFDGNVGIGTTSPNTLLHVDGNARVGDQLTIGSGSGSWDWLNWDGSGKTLRMHFGDANNELRFGRYGTGFAPYEANVVTFDMDAAVNTLFVAGNSRVGIGTNAPAQPLDVAGHARINAGGNWSFLNLGSEVYDQLYADNSAGKGYGGGLWFRIGNAAGTGYTDSLRMAENGNVGIGTNPTQRLHVAGNSYLQGTLYLGSTDTALFRDAANRIATDDQLYVRPASPNTYLYSTNTYLGNTSGDTTHLRGNTFRWNQGIIQGNGNVGIGTSTPGAKLNVVGGAWIDVTGGGDFLVADTSKGSVSNVVWYDQNVGRLYLGNTGGSGANPEVTVRGDLQVTGAITGASIPGDNMGNMNATTRLNMNDHDIQMVRELELRDFDDNTGGTDNKYRLLGRDGAWSFHDGGVVIGRYGNNAWTDVPNGRLIVQNQIGIGTTPTGNLASGASLAIGDGDTGLKQMGDGQLAFYTNNGQRMRLTNAGNVGIGTTGPIEKLTVVNNTDNVIQSQTTGTTNWASFRAVTPNKSVAFGNNDLVNTYGIFDNTVGEWNLAISYNTGWVGIGTENPTARLFVNGDLRATTDIEVGAGSGSVAMTINDGGGNANVTFNHRDRVPDQTGNAGRITVNTDATSNAYMGFELANNLPAGVANNTSQIFRIDADGRVRAAQYCDENGGNCKTTTQMTTRCTNVNWNQGFELTAAERPDGNRYMVMPGDVSMRCEQLGYDFGFVRKRFGRQHANGTNSGWCDGVWSNHRTAYYDNTANAWRSTSLMNGDSCVGGPVAQARCCHMN